MGVIFKNENKLGEKMFITTLSCGVKCYIIPKYGFTKSQASVVFNYGSSDIKFSYDGEELISPKGTAHFIEHKMFEKENGNYFVDFVQNGCEANAFTDFSKTAYYFSGKNNFYDNFGRLIEMTQNFHSTDLSIEREKAIIGQEIAMYDDNADWVVYMNLLKKLYKNHPVRYAISGTKASIDNINLNSLTTAYNTFYVPQNMSIVVCGNVDYKKIEDIAEKFIVERPSLGTKLPAKEPSYISTNFVKSRMNLGIPTFNIGFKHSDLQPNIEDIFGYKMLLDIILGDSSYLSSRLLDNKAMVEGFGFQYLWGRDLSLSVVMGRSKEPRRVANEVVREILRYSRMGISNEVFERIKTKHLGRFIRGFNSIDAICMAQTELSVIDKDLFEGFNVIRNMEKSTLERLLSQFDPHKVVLSVVE
ncbi:MAG: EF-P 5-aminopentanol modification-associated protein YfmH [Anaerotignaceae bacterium]